MGKARRDGYRDKVFLMTKVDGGVANLDQDVNAGRTFRPMTQDEITKLLARTAQAAKAGQDNLALRQHRASSRVAW